MLHTSFQNAEIPEIKVYVSHIDLPYTCRTPAHPHTRTPAHPHTRTPAHPPRRCRLSLAPRMSRSAVSIFNQARFFLMFNVKDDKNDLWLCFKNYLKNSWKFRTCTASSAMHAEAYRARVPGASAVRVTTLGFIFQAVPTQSTQRDNRRWCTLLLSLIVNTE